MGLLSKIFGKDKKLIEQIHKAFIEELIKKDPELKNRRDELSSNENIRLIEEALFEVREYYPDKKSEHFQRALDIATFKYRSLRSPNLKETREIIPPKSYSSDSGRIVQLRAHRS